MLENGVRFGSTLLFAALACAGCGADASKQKPPLEVLVKVDGDPGQKLEGATLHYNGKVIATTGKDGAALLTLNGNEGDTYDVSIKCPTGYQSPQKPITIPLHRLADPTQKPEYEVSCPPTTRTVVVAVRAENGPNLPIMYLGRVVGRTDAAGAATVLLEGIDADTQFDLTLDTTEKGNEQLRPQNPSSSFTLKNADEIFTFDVKFVVEAKAKVYKWAPKKQGPVMLPTKGIP